MDDLLSGLDAVEKLATASKINRFMTRPLKYGFAMLFNKIVYPVAQKGILKKTGTFFGLPMYVLLPAGTDIYVAGGKTHDSEIRLARFLIRTLQPQDVFVDVGAHFGYFSLLASRLVPEGAVFSFEASGNNFDLLKRNVGKTDNIRTVHNAVSDSNEPVEFYELPVVYSEYNTTEPEQFQKEGWYLKIRPEKKMVVAVTLDKFLTDNHLRPAIIKIDVEGAELKVIRGGTEYLKNQAPLVIMEYLEPRRNNGNHRMAADLLRDLQYLPHVITRSGALEVCHDIDAYLDAGHHESDNIVFVKNI